MDNETRIRRAQTFDEIADLYDRGRREVPAQVFTDLFSRVAIEPKQAQVLEIGCGTGQATLPLARRGCTVTALEMGAHLAELARARLAGFPRVAIVNIRFEDWLPQERKFDILFAANAWHWIDPQVGYAKAAAALGPGGVLAFTKAIHVFPADCDPFFSAIQSCYEQIGQARIPWPPPPPEATPDLRDEIEQSGWFTEVEVIRRIRVEEFTADEYVGLMQTASDHRLMEPAKREYLFAEMRRLIDASADRRIRKHNLTLLHIARRKSDLS